MNRTYVRWPLLYANTVRAEGAYTGAGCFAGGIHRELDASKRWLSMTACIFCEIVAGRAKASIVYQDASIISFLDYAPITPGHLLVVPRAHVSSLSDLDDTTGAHAFVVAKQLARAVYRSSLVSDGIMVWLADGEAAGQEVPHLHLHVLPRIHGDGVRLTFKRGRAPTRAQLDALATDVRASSELQ